MSGNGMNGGLPGLGMEAARGLACSVLTQGQTVILQFQVATPSDIAPGGRIAVALPASGLRNLRSAIHKAIDAADRTGWYPRSFGVGHPERMRNTLAVTFEDTPNEMTFLFDDATARQLAQCIMDDIMGRMSAAERAKLASGLLTPNCRLLVPGKG